jgi:hypothetical protein
MEKWDVMCRMSCKLFKTWETFGQHVHENIAGLELGYQVQQNYQTPDNLEKRYKTAAQSEIEVYCFTSAIKE